MSDPTTNNRRRIDLKIGDTLFVKDIELVITNIVHAYGPDGDSMRLDCMDPLMAQKRMDDMRGQREAMQKAKEMCDLAIKEMKDDGLPQ